MWIKPHHPGQMRDRPKALTLIYFQSFILLTNAFKNLHNLCVTQSQQDFQRNSNVYGVFRLKRFHIVKCRLA